MAASAVHQLPRIRSNIDSMFSSVEARSVVPTEYHLAPDRDLKRTRMNGLKYWFSLLTHPNWSKCLFLFGSFTESERLLERTSASHLSVNSRFSLKFKFLTLVVSRFSLAGLARKKRPGWLVLYFAIKWLPWAEKSVPSQVIRFQC